MARRNKLRSVAHNVAASFMSRNNGADGYWAFGFLLEHALTSGETTFSIDCVSGQASAVFDSAPLEALPLRYGEIFWNQVQRQGIPPGCIRIAVIGVSSPASEFQHGAAWWNTEFRAAFEFRMIETNPTRER